MIPFYFALPPEVNSALLNNGPGPFPLWAAAADYAKVAAALTGAAAASDGSMSQMTATWGGPAAERAERAFRNHANWLRAQAQVAAQASAQATVIADANALARSVMPSTATILANRAATAVLVAGNGMGQNTPLIAMNEAVYYAMWMLAANTMSTYHAAATGALAALPAPAIPPEITSGGAGNGPSIPSPRRDLTPGSGPGDDSSRPDLGGGHPGSDRDTRPVGDRTPGADPGPGRGTDPGPPPGESLPGRPGPAEPDLPGADPGPVTPDPVQPISDVPQSLPPGVDGLGGPESLPGSTPEQPGFWGTSPESPTLAGLNGGAGSAVALALTRGGLGAMPGAGTGFRLPASWNPMGVRAFGAGLGSPMLPAAPQRPAPAGVSAPRAQLRRRREEQDRKPGKAFASGEQQEVPVLEQPPAIGVIEYTEVDGQPESASEQLLAAGLPERPGDRPAS
ncbi:PPE domain-containing protein [Nocardia sp. NPDC003693]